MRNLLITHKNNLVFVPVSNSKKTVVLDAPDFDVLMANGISPKWNLSQAGKVMVANNKTVARLILGAARGLRVKYIDNDPTNLRRDNLVLANNSLPLVIVDHQFDRDEEESAMSAN